MSSRGYLPPPNYHTDYSRGFERRGIKVLLRDVPIGYYFEVISRGYGGMPDYASQIPPDDRWKIIAYVRSLQLSQWAPLKDLSGNERGQGPERIAAWGGATVSSAITPATSLESSPRAELTGADWDRFRRTALYTAGGGLAAFVLLGFLLWWTGGIDPQRQFFLSYLVAYNYWLGSALGALVFLMLQYVTGGAWGLLLRRILEAGAGTLPLLAVLFLPVLCGLPFASQYSQWSPVQTSEELHFKAVWLSAPFVLVRAVIYFACWIGMAGLFSGWSKQQDEGADGHTLKRCEALEPRPASWRTP